ncbi:unnamed protein product [Schistosoma mattheei]|uniref:Uncharacterized protein n=1 Tax=Schistosoma mattheei TaxID=31246 RepID=A0A183NY21_9TREM|nr:unnamed protein product [Schistosoma mattheei]
MFGSALAILLPIFNNFIPRLNTKLKGNASKNTIAGTGSSSSISVNE